MKWLFVHEWCSGVRYCEGDVLVPCMQAELPNLEELLFVGGCRQHSATALGVTV